MNDQELEILLNDLESDRVERKASISDRSVIRQAVCAFANDLPNYQQAGVLFIGDETFQAHISVASDITASVVELRHPDYPIVALQQLARNAVMHRTYEGTYAPVRITWFNDRIEIQNPGGPFGQVNRQNFGQPGITDYRNPHLAEAMKNLGYVQRFGVGIQLARKELEKNGNPPLEFVVEDAHVLVTLKKKL